MAEQKIKFNSKLITLFEKALLFEMHAQSLPDGGAKDWAAQCSAEARNHLVCEAAIRFPAPKIARTLRNALPHEALDGTFDDLPFNKHLDCCIIAEHHTYEVRWPGSHKNVVVWWELEGGYAVGWNENMSIGWTFPTIRYAVKGNK